VKDPPQFPPRLLTKEQAAAHCGVSAATFAIVCPIAPISLGKGERLRRYDIRRLNRWIDSLADGAERVDHDWLAEMDGGDDHRARQRH
jgi:hypothetical protein